MNGHLIFRDPFAQLPREPIALRSVGEPLAAEGNPPGAYFVNWGRFMAMDWGEVTCPGCGRGVLLSLPDSVGLDRLAVVAGNLFTGEALTFDRPITHAAPHGCGATFRITNGAVVQ